MSNKQQYVRTIQYQSVVGDRASDVSKVQTYGTHLSKDSEF